MFLTHGIAKHLRVNMMKYSFEFNTSYILTLTPKTNGVVSSVFMMVGAI